MKLIGMLTLAVLVSLFVIGCMSIPLGVPGEWLWPRQAFPTDVSEWADRFLSPVLFGAAVVAFCRFADCRIEGVRVLGKLSLIIGLVVAAFFWQRIVQHASASPHRELRPLWVLYDKYATGYFFITVFTQTTSSELIATYEARMAQGDVLHEGTHPPGLLLMNRWALVATERWRWLADLSRATISPTSIRLFQQLEKQAGLARSLTDSELSALCLVSTLSCFLAASTVIPVFLMVARLGSFQMAWRAACLTLTAPSIAVFLPRSDVIYACSGAWLFLAIVLSLTARSNWSSGLWAAFGAFVLFKCLFFSLAHLPVLMAGGVFGLLAWQMSGTQGDVLTFRRLLLVASVAITSFAAIVFVFDKITDCNMLTVWRWNLQNHESFYSTSVRTWWKWALVNPVELAFSAGLPMAIVAFCQATRSALGIFRGKVQGERSLTNALLLAMVFTWCCLWLSGKNMGEAARLWCFMTPWVAIAAGVSFGTLGCWSDSTCAVERKPATCSTQLRWLITLGCQLAICVATNGLVTGYLEM
jgi:hypothetical protein